MDLDVLNIERKIKNLERDTEKSIIYKEHSLPPSPTDGSNGDIEIRVVRNVPMLYIKALNRWFASPLGKPEVIKKIATSNQTQDTIMHKNSYIGEANYFLNSSNDPDITGINTLVLENIPFSTYFIGGFRGGVDGQILNVIVSGNNTTNFALKIKPKSDSSAQDQYNIRARGQASDITVGSSTDHCRTATFIRGQSQFFNIPVWYHIAS